VPPAPIRYWQQLGSTWLGASMKKALSTVASSNRPTVGAHPAHPDMSCSFAAAVKLH
jgi:hypothetical protein